MRKLDFWHAILKVGFLKKNIVPKKRLPMKNMNSSTHNEKI